jgi:hypothetical protein
MDNFKTADLGWLTCEIVVIGDPERDHSVSYRISCHDLETGRLIGSGVLPARADGRPLRVSLGDIITLIGGYRLASIYVEIESERLARRNRALLGHLRHRDRSWLRRAQRSVLYETAVEHPPRISKGGASHHD